MTSGIDIYICHFQDQKHNCKKSQLPPPRGYMTKGDVKVVGGEGDEIP